MTDAAVPEGRDVGSAGSGDSGGSAVSAGPGGSAGSAGSGSSIPIGLVWAQSSDGTIGVGGVMPWHLPEDLAHFKAVTLGAPVVMGRKTWDSLPARFRPLAGRRNIVVTRQLDWTADGAEVVHSVEAALALAGAEAGAGTGAGTGTGAEAGAGVAAVDAVVDRSAPVHRVWVIGGAELFASVIDIADLLEVTEIDAAFDGDTAAPAIDGTWSVVAVDPDDAAAPAGAATSSAAATAADAWHTSRTGLPYRFLTYARP